MRITILLVTTITVTLLTGCAGRAAYPVAVNQHGDSRKSCESLSKELAFIEAEIQRLIPKTEKTTKNAVLATTGVFLIVPWLFMDFTESEMVEINALRQRYNNLTIISDEKQCATEVDNENS
jgi:preprotein translocase subunit Sec63